MKPDILALSLLLIVGCTRSGAAERADASAADGAIPGQALEQRGERPIDLAISDRVREAILRDKRVATDAGSIRVATQDGVVTLSGFVTSDAVKKRAAVVAKAVGSVVRVDNKLVVDAEAAARTRQHMESVVERAISDRVRLALQGDRTTGPGARSVRVLTEDGVVTLSGTVTSDVVKARCVVVAKAVGSVKRVDDRLEVQKP